MFTRTLAAFAALTALCVAPFAAQAQDKVKGALCVFDPSGANGQIFNMMKDYKLKALEWGVDFEMKPYQDEKTAADDFKAGKCLGALITATRLRPFHKFAGTLEAVGAMPTYELTKDVFRSLSKKGARKLMTNGDFEVAALFPGGAIYLMVNDRAINTVDKLAGKKISTLQHDDASKTMVRKVGASMMLADVGTFAGMFNNGSVDACYAPGFAYKALELYKGMGDKGAIVRFPLAQMTLQLLVRTKDLPEGFGIKSRAEAFKNYDRALEVVRKAEADIPEKHWMDIPVKDKPQYEELLRSVRIDLRDKAGLYHGTALKLMRKARCKKDPTRAECVEKTE